MNDLASALTDSLSRSGDGNMSAQLKATDGTKLAPGLSWASEASSGLYWAGTGDVRMSVANADICRFHSSSGLQVWDGGAWRDVFKGTVGDAEGQLVTWNNTDGIWEKEAGAVIDGSGNFWLG
jgi:hypothetical protein